MHRRTLLKAGAGSLPLTVVPRAASSAQAGYEPLDSIEVPGAAELVVHHDNEIAYVAAGDGIAVVDISDKTDLRMLAERRGIEIGSTPLTAIWDCWAWEDRLAAVGPAQEKPDSATGFALFDIADPASPELLSTHETEYYIHNCFLDDGLLYLTGSGLFEAEARIPLVIYDLRGGEPTELTRWSPRDHDTRWRDVPINNRVLHDVSVHDDVASLAYWDAGTWLLDVSDPTEIEVLSRFGDYQAQELIDLSGVEASNQGVTPPGNAHVTTVNEDGSLLAVGKETWDLGTVTASGGASGVELWDIQDRTAPTRLATIEPPESFQQTPQAQFTTAHNCAFAGDRLYTSWYYGGVKVHDIAEPEAPEELAWWRDPETTSFWAARAAEPGEYFVACSADMPLLDRDNPETQGGVYTFPDRRGQQADPPSLTGTPTPRDESDDGLGPGFGLGTALAALGGAGYLLGRRRSEES